MREFRMKNLECRIKKLAVALLVVVYSQFSILNSAFAVGALITKGGAAYSISSPYQAEDLSGLQTIQSADVMYIVHQDYATRQLSRFSDTDWTLEVVDFTGGPFMDENKDEDWTITPSAKTGDITLTASADTFEAGHVGALWRINHLMDANTISGDLSGVSSSATLEVQAGRDIDLTTSGNYIVTAKLERSYDGGSTWRDASRTFYLNGVQDGNLHYADTEAVANALYRFTVVTYQYGPIGFVLSARPGEFGGIVEITGVSDARTASATVETGDGELTDFDLADTTATFRWSEGSWSEKNGYPGAVTFFQERLVLGGTKNEPQSVWLSQTDDWTNFKSEELEDSALRFLAASDQVNAIQWLVGHSTLLIGTSGGEWKLSGGTSQELTFKNYNMSRQSTYGSERIQAMAINNNVVYAQREAEKIRQMRFAFEQDAWLSPDLSLLAEHITKGGITEMAYQRIPQPTLWCVRSDGQLLGVTLEDSQEVVGWYRYIFDGDVKSVAVIPGTNEDQVWIAVRRTIEGVDKRYIEQFQPIYFGDQEDAFYVDSGLSFDGGAAVVISNITQADPAVVTAPGHSFTDGWQVRMSSVAGMTEVNNEVYSVSTVSGSAFELRDSTDTVDIDSTGFTAYSTGGSVLRVENNFVTLGHLEGETVVANGDGGYAGSYTVSGATITLSDFYNKAHVGLPYTAKFQPMPLEFATTGGALQGLTKKINATNIRFDRSLSCSVGPTWTDYDTYAFRRATDPLEAATPLFTGDLRMLFDGPYDRMGNICIQDSKPVPLTILAMIIEYEAMGN